MYWNFVHRYIFPNWYRYIIHTCICLKRRSIFKIIWQIQLTKNGKTRMLVFQFNLFRMSIIFFTTLTAGVNVSIVIPLTGSVLVLLNFCWRVHIISFFTKGARSFHMDFSLQNHVILVAWMSSLCTFKWKMWKFQQNEHTPGVHELVQIRLQQTVADPTQKMW